MTYLSLDSIEDENLFLHIIYQVVLHCPSLVRRLEGSHVRSIIQELHHELFFLKLANGSHPPLGNNCVKGSGIAQHYHLHGCSAGSSSSRVVNPDSIVMKPLPSTLFSLNEEGECVASNHLTENKKLSSLFQGTEVSIIEANEEEVHLIFSPPSSQAGLVDGTQTLREIKVEKESESEIFQTIAGEEERIPIPHTIRTIPLNDASASFPSTSADVHRTSSLHPGEILLVVRRLSGGITNELFHVYSPDNETSLSSSVVVRVFGKETEQFISRESELFYQRQFLQTYVWGNNFLIYEYLQGFQALQCIEMSSRSLEIADAMAEFQVKATVAARDGIPLTYDEMCLTPSPIPDSDEDEENRINNSTDNSNTLKEGKSAIAENPASTSPSPHWNRGTPRKKEEGKKYLKVDTHEGLFSTSHKSSRFDQEKNFTKIAMTTWIAQALTDKITSKIDLKKREQFTRLAQALQRECEWMVKELKVVEEGLIEGVCHNDLLCGNLMWSANQKKLKIIDFDYTHRNFLLFDLANHFNEYAGMEFDYATTFPSDEDMKAFIVRYRQAMRRYLGLPAVPSTPLLGKATACVVPRVGCPEGDQVTLPLTTSDSTPSPPTLARMRKEAGENPTGSTSVHDVFLNQEVFAIRSVEEEDEIVSQWTRYCKGLTLASHLLWAVWALLQEAYSALPDVDFLDFGTKRFQRFMETKEAFKVLP